MRVVLFNHSLLSDWNHGNAHFLRGVCTELLNRGAEVVAAEPLDSWSATNLVAEWGGLPIPELFRHYPKLEDGLVRYDPDDVDLDSLLDGADVVIVHEWTDPALVARIGRVRANGGRFLLLFHDTHHRSVTAPDELDRYDLSAYDGVLAFGRAIARVYERRGWSRRVFVWHEAADTRIFRPLPRTRKPRDVVWIGNWGDDERTAELDEFLIGPARRLGLRGVVHGVRYPATAVQKLRGAGLTYRGWLPNYRVPEVFAAHRVTVHVPRRPYVQSLPGIPTIRPFEAMACGIPLISAPWDDVEGLFAPGVDYLVARDGAEMDVHLRDLIADEEYADQISTRALATIRARHTCAHRVDELLDIVGQLRGRRPMLEVA